MALAGLRMGIASRVLDFLSYRAEMLYYSYNWYLRIIAFLATIIRVSKGQSHNLALSKCKTPMLCMLSIRVVKRRTLAGVCLVERYRRLARSSTDRKVSCRVVNAKGETPAGVCLVEQCRRLARSSTKWRSHVVVEVVWRSGSLPWCLPR